MDGKRRIGLNAIGALSLLLFLFWAFSPPQVLVTMPPRQHVETTNPKAGVHTRLTDEVESWKIQKTLAMVRELGTPWIVEYFPWAYIEPESGAYDWRHSDLVVEHARNQGLTVIARLGLVPSWARPDPEELETTLTYLDPAQYPDFARFVGAFVARYRGQVEHVIIWNEPNLSFEWGYRDVDPLGYTALLRAAYEAAHGANPEIVVLGGALAPTLEPPGSSAGLNDLIYLKAMYEAGAAEVMDGLAAHAYGLAFPPEAAPGKDLLNFRRVELLREIMIHYGDEASPIYVTEAGWNDHPRWTWSVSPGLRVAYTRDAYRWAADQWPWCPTVAMWMFRTPQPLHNYQDAYTFVTPDFRKKPIYNEIQETLRPRRP